MKRTELKAVPKDTMPGTRPLDDMASGHSNPSSVTKPIMLGILRTDRLTQALVWMAILLTAVLAAVATDMALSPSSRGAVAQAVGPSPQPVAFVPSPQPTAVPTDAASPTPSITPPTPITPPPCVPPRDWGIHIVEEGNTLYSLAERYGTDVDTLMLVNCLNTDTIFIDQRLYVPGSDSSVMTLTPLPTATLAPSATPAASQMPTVTETLTQTASTTPLSATIPIPTGTARPAASATLPPLDVAAVSTVPAAPLSKQALKVNMPDRYLNIVLLGSDKRPNNGAWRTDSMIVVSVDSELNVVRLLSIPRDLWVYIPGHGNNRINTADLWGELAKKGGGPTRVKQTIHHNLGIPIHYYVRVDFEGFMNIIDTVGGVTIDVECPLPDIKLSAGIHQMNSRQALRYARSRKSTNDFDRTRRQRKVLMALWQQALTLDIIPKIPTLWSQLSKSFDTDLPLDQVINLAYLGTKLKPQRILSKAIGPKQVAAWTTSQGAAVLLPQHDKIRAMLQQFYKVKDPSDQDASEKVHVRVLKGAQRNASTELAAAALRWEGFKVAGTGTADSQDHAQTRILVYSGDMAAGQTVSATLKVPKTAVKDASSEEQPDPENPVDIVVILGRDYDPCQR